MKQNIPKKELINSLEYFYHSTERLAEKEGRCLEDTEEKHFKRMKAIIRKS